MFYCVMNHSLTIHKPAMDHLKENFVWKKGLINILNVFILLYKYITVL